MNWLIALSLLVAPTAFAADTVILSNGQSATLEAFTPTQVKCGVVQRICTLTFNPSVIGELKASFYLDVNEEGKIRTLRRYHVGTGYEFQDIELARTAAKSAAGAIEKSGFCVLIDKI